MQTQFDIHFPLSATTETDAARHAGFDGDAGQGPDDRGAARGGPDSAASPVLTDTENWVALLMEFYPEIRAEQEAALLAGKQMCSHCTRIRSVPWLYEGRCERCSRRSEARKAAWRDECGLLPYDPAVGKPVGVPDEQLTSDVGSSRGSVARQRPAPRRRRRTRWATSPACPTTTFASFHWDRHPDTGLVTR